MSETKSEFNRCPSCNQLVNTPMQILSAGNPETLAYLVCFSCAAILVFHQAEKTLRRPSLDEWGDVLADPVFFAELKEHQRLVTYLIHKIVADESLESRIRKPH